MPNFEDFKFVEISSALNYTQKYVERFEKFYKQTLN